MRLPWRCERIELLHKSRNRGGADDAVAAAPIDAVAGSVECRTGDHGIERDVGDRRLLRANHEKPANFAVPSRKEAVLADVLEGDRQGRTAALDRAIRDTCNVAYRIVFRSKA